LPAQFDPYSMTQSSTTGAAVHQEVRHQTPEPERHAELRFARLYWELKSIAPIQDIKPHRPPCAP
jgi:hypothetical protein